MPVNNEGRSLVNRKSEEKFMTFRAPFNYADVVNAQSGEAYSLKKSSRATLISFLVADMYGIFSK